MNNASLFSLEEKKKNLYMQFGVDQDSIKSFMAEVSEVSEEEANRLGKELLELISKKGYNIDNAIDLIKRGANVNYKNDRKGDFPLLICARKGYFKTFIALIKGGAKVNQTNNYFTTALMAAARHGQADMVRVLLLFNADINARCLDGDNAIFSAKRHNQKECFNILLRANAKLTTKNLANETFMDVSGDVSFDSKHLESKEEVRRPDTTKDDAETLIEEAKEKVKRMFPN